MKALIRIRLWNKDGYRRYLAIFPSFGFGIVIEYYSGDGKTMTGCHVLA